MTASLTGFGSLSVELTYNQNNLGIAINPKISAGPNGTNGAVIPNVKLSYGNGTVLDANGAIECQDAYFFQGNIGATTTKSVNLNTGSDLDVNGVALAFIKVKYWLVAITQPPDGVMSLKVGPQGVTDAWQGPFGGVGATIWKQFYWRDEWFGPAAGLTVTASTACQFNVNNPGASAVQTLIIIAGTSS